MLAVLAVAVVFPNRTMKVVTTPPLVWSAAIAIALFWMLRQGVRRLAVVAGLKHCMTAPPNWIGVATGIAGGLFILSEGWVKQVALSDGSVTQVGQLAGAFLLVPAAALVAGLISASTSLSDLRKTRPYAEHQPKIEQWYQTDQALVGIDSDRFDSAPIASRIANRLKEPALRGVPSQALIGGLGSGKTTIKNFVEQLLDREKRISIVTVELWPYDTTAAAVQGVMTSLLEAIALEINVWHLRGIPSSYASAVTTIAQPLAPILQAKPRQPVELVDEIDRTLLAIGAHYVLWVEDLERFAIGDPDTDEAETQAEAEKLAPIRALLYALNRCKSISVITATTNLYRRFDLEKIADYVERIPRVPAETARRIIAERRSFWLSEDFVDPVSPHLRHSLGWEGSTIPPALRGLFDNTRINSVSDGVVTLCGTPRVLGQVLRRSQDVWDRLKGEIDLDAVIAISAIREAVPHCFALLEERIPVLRGEQGSRDERQHALLNFLKALEKIANSQAEAEAVSEIVKGVVMDKDLLQGFGSALHADYWMRYNSFSGLGSDLLDQSVLQWINKTDVVLLSDALTKPPQSDAVEHFGSLLPVHVLYSILKSLGNKWQDDDVSHWEDRLRPPGLIPLWRLFLTRQKHGLLDSNVLLETILPLYDRLVDTNVVAVVEVEHFLVSGSEVGTLLSVEQQNRAKSHLRKLVVERLVGRPDLVSKLLSKADQRVLLWLVWTIENVKSHSYSTIPFDGWDSFAATLLEAATIGGINLRRQVALMLIDEVGSIGPRSTWQFARERAERLFGSADAVFQAFEGLSPEEQSDDFIAAILQASAGTDASSEERPRLPNSDALSPEAATKNRAEGELSRLVQGFWFPDAEDLPDAEPDYLYTGCVLPQKLADSFLALDLVLIEGTWSLLVDAAMYGYAHSEGLQRGECWIFGASIENEWRTFDVSLVPPIAAEELTEVYGTEVKELTRSDRPLVQLQFVLHRK